MVRALKNVVVTISPKGQNVVILGGDGSIKIWSNAGEELGDIASSLSTPKEPLEATTIAWIAVPAQNKKRKNQLLVVGTKSGSLVAWDTARGEVKWKYSNYSSGPVAAVCFSEKQKALYVCGGEDGMVSQHNPLTGNLVQQFRGAKQAITALAVSPDGSMLATAGRVIKILNTTTKKTIRRLPGHENPVKCLAFTADGSCVVSSATNEKNIKLWGIPSPNSEAPLELSVKRPVAALGFAQEPAVLRVVAISETGDLYVWSGRSSEKLGKNEPFRLRAEAERYALQARFLSSDSLLLVRGTVSRPAFDTVKLSADEDVGVDTTASGSSDRKRKRSPEQIDKPPDEVTAGRTDSETKPPKKKSRKSVTFGEVTILGPDAGEPLEADAGEPLEADPNNSEEPTGKRVKYDWFTKEEDDTIRKAAVQAVEDAGWDVDFGLQVLVGLQNGDRKLKSQCFTEIANALPHRTRMQVARRASNVLDTWRKRANWTEEEVAQLYKLMEEHGQKWTKIADIMGRRWEEVRFKWRYERNQKNRGAWKPEEVEELCNLVHKDLALQAIYGDSKRKLISGISWTAVADALGTRPDTHCMRYWYDRLNSPKLKTGDWAVEYDSQLLLRLLESGAGDGDEESIEWGSLLDDKSAAECQQRWKEMCSVLGKHKNASFETKLELLVKRFAPAFLDPSIDELVREHRLKAEAESAK